MTSKAVLILGNFVPERKEVLEVIKERLRERGILSNAPSHRLP